MKQRKVHVTPTLARKLLESNTDNRNMRMSYVHQLAEDMKAGRYIPEFGSRIVFDTDGVMRNGQHTLMAISVSGCEYDLEFIEGAPPDCYEVIDTGLSRKFSDSAGRHTPNANYQAAVAKMLMREELGARVFGGGTTARNRFSYAQQQRFIEEHPEINATLSKATRMHYAVGVPKSIAGYCIVKFEQFDAGKAEEFIEAVITGEGLRKGDPALTLRDRLIKDWMTKNTGMTKEAKLAITIKAFNAFCSGKKIAKLQFDAEREKSFPTVGGVA